MREKNLSKINLIKKPILTKKTLQLINLNQYTIEVDRKVTKPILKKLIEKLFNVNVCKINTYNLTKKKRITNTRNQKKSKNYLKRAIITLKSDQTLPIFLNQTD
uniref:Large ribosomal subunit protein uL23c n=1 Tax=Palmophyllum crassum TaxID=1615899 RepID=A0A1L7NXW2_9VIRI|nr:ribosomal protein L23 [Palmophyllum crassum]BAW34753.1 ribosomal protein L23 [Palmophyllum crassum]